MFGVPHSRSQENQATILPKAPKEQTKRLLFAVVTLIATAYWI